MFNRWGFKADPNNVRLWMRISAVSRESNPTTELTLMWMYQVSGALNRWTTQSKNMVYYETKKQRERNRARGYVWKGILTFVTFCLYFSRMVSEPETKWDRVRGMGSGKVCELWLELRMPKSQWCYMFTTLMFNIQHLCSLKLHLLWNIITI